MNAISLQFVSILFPLFIVWALGMLWFMFRPRGEWIWKISSLLLLVVYGIWFWDRIEESRRIWSTNFAHTMAIFFYGIGDMIGLLLLLLWPLSLWSIGGRIPVELVRKRMRMIVLVTLFYWILRLTDSLMPPYVERTIRIVLDFLAPYLNLMQSPPL